VALMKVQLEENYQKMVKSKLLAAKMEQLAKVFARHDYQNVLALTFLNKEPDQSASQIAERN
jgi:hypothetical protein